MLKECFSTFTGKKWVFFRLGMRRERNEKGEVFYMAYIHVDKRLVTNIERKLSKRLGVSCTELSERILEMEFVYVWTVLI
jgi:hypothetical protein